MDFISIQDHITLDYDDVWMIPEHVSEIDSREKIRQNFKDNPLELYPNTFLSAPIVSAPMADVIDANMCLHLRRCGAYGILHRFSPIDEQINQFLGAKKDCGASIGVNGDYLERYEELYKYGCRNFLIDVANGANKNVERAINKCLKRHNDTYFIVGNVISPTCFSFLSNIHNVVAIRVGIGGGEVCTTRHMTGVYMPAITCLLDINNHKKRNKLTTKMIADGGINAPHKFCKALACGANFCMMGSVLANTKESPVGRKTIWDSEFENKTIKFNGSASFNNQEKYKNKPRFIEGQTKKLQFSDKSVEEVIENYMDGLVSSMSYMNAMNLDEYRNNMTLARTK